MTFAFTELSVVRFGHLLVVPVELVQVGLAQSTVLVESLEVVPFVRFAR